MNLNAIATPVVREAGPLVTRRRSLTVARKFLDKAVRSLLEERAAEIAARTLTLPADLYSVGVTLRRRDPDLYYTPTGQVVGKVLPAYQEVWRLLAMTILDLQSDATICALNVGTTTSISPTDHE